MMFFSALKENTKSECPVNHFTELNVDSFPNLNVSPKHTQQRLYSFTVLQLKLKKKKNLPDKVSEIAVFVQYENLNMYKVCFWKSFFEGSPSEFCMTLLKPWVLCNVL